MDPDDFGLEIVIPDVSLLLDGQYRRDGDNLEIIGSHGDVWTVDGYFAYAEPPVLSAPNGALLLPETVRALIVVDPTAHATMVAGPTVVTEGPPALGQQIGKVGEILGKLKAKGTDGVERLLKEGDAIYKGDVIQTQKGELIKLVLVDGTTFQLGENARATLDKYVYNPAAKEGGFEATVTKGIFSFESGGISGLHSGRHTTIKTPTAVVGIRGSKLSGEVTDDGSTTVVHTAGVLEIADAKGQGMVTLVEPGTATQVHFGAGAPEPVFKAPAAFMARLDSQLDIGKAKEEQKTEESGKSENKQEKSPEGKKETTEGDPGGQEGKTEGSGPGESKAEEGTSQEGEKKAVEEETKAASEGVDDTEKGTAADTAADRGERG